MDYYDTLLAIEQEKREHLEDQWAEHWDMTKADLAKAVDQFGWDEVNRFISSLKPKGFTGTLPDGREVIDGLSIN